MLRSSSSFPKQALHVVEERAGLDGWMDRLRWMDGWMDGAASGLDGWMDGWMEGGAG